MQVNLRAIAFDLIKDTEKTTSNEVNYINCKFPRSGFVKINMNASVPLDEGTVSFGGIVIDDTRRWMLGFNGLYWKHCDSISGALAHSSGFKIDKGGNWKNVNIFLGGYICMNMSMTCDDW